jgi:hypothetical protein
MSETVSGDAPGSAPADAGTEPLPGPQPAAADAPVTAQDAATAASVEHAPPPPPPPPDATSSTDDIPSRGTRARRTRGPAAPTGFPWERSPLAGVPSTAILAELQRRRERTAALLAERERIAEQVADIEARLAALGERLPRGAAGAGAAGTVRAGGGARPGRGRNAVGLADAIAQAVEAQAIVTPAEVAERVRRNGYVTTSKTFAQAVSLALSRHAGFRRVGRGRYERLA